MAAEPLMRLWLVTAPYALAVIRAGSPEVALWRFMHDESDVDGGARASGVERGTGEADVEVVELVAAGPFGVVDEHTG